MKLHMFSVYDKKAAAFLPPFFLPTTAMAQRVFKDCVQDAEHQFGKHPEDYSLYFCGAFDDVAGCVDVMKEPEVVLTGLSVVALSQGRIPEGE